MRMSSQLLVSVRSPQEASAALDGGAGIIDVKEPSRGPLGRAHSNVIAEVTELVRSRSPGTIVSAALGEVAEAKASARIDLTHSVRPDLLKSGLSTLHANPDSWQDAWHTFRKTVTFTDQKTKWVAVAYADSVRSQSPPAPAVIEEAHRIGCPVLLIDTFYKDGKSLMDWISAEELHQIRCRTREYGMQLALAGQITTGLLPVVLPFDPDIIAVRGAVCEDGHRGATVTTERVRQICTALQADRSLSGRF